jgi:WD40 repeat protein
VVVVVATLSLRRILADRDRIAGAQARAETALADARATAESLLVDKARAIVEHDPSHALALLRELPRDSPRWSIDANAVASAARQRGVRFAFVGHPGATNVLALSPDGNRLLSHGSDHQILLHDLVKRTTHRLVARQRAPLWAVWVGDMVAVFNVGDHEALTLIDPDTGRESRIAAPNVQQLCGSFTEWMAWEDHERRVWVARATDRAGTELPLDPAIEIGSLTLQPEAEWLVAHGDVATQVFRRTGDRWSAFATIPVPSVTGELAPDGKHLALGAWELITEWRLDDKPVQTGTWGGRKWVTLKYSSDREMLYGQDVTSTLVPLHEETRSTPQVAAMATPLAEGLLASGDSDVLRIVGNGFELRVPTGGHIARTASHPGGRFLVGATENLIYVWDVTETIPDRIDDDQIDFAIPAANYMVVGSGKGGFVEWLDGKSPTRRFDTTPPPIGFTADDVDLLAWSSPDGIAVLSRDGTIRNTPVDEARVVIPRPDDTLVVGRRDGKIARVAIGSGATTILGKISNPVDFGISNRGQLAMYTVQGTIWRSTDNAVLPGFDTIADAWITDDGTIYLARATTIVRWNVGSTDVVHVVDLPQRVVMIRGLAGTSRLSVVTADNAVYAVTPETAQYEQLAGPGATATMSRDGRVVVRMSPTRIDVVDLIQRIDWSIPAVGQSYKRIAMMPDGSGVIANDEHAGSLLWDFGRDDISDAAAWVESRTNARAGKRRELTWDLPPIQTFAPTR